jgi:glutamine synthetase
VLRAVERHQDLVRSAVAYAGNDHRLGANEAPPAIISVFLGEQLEDVFTQIEKSGRAKSSKRGGLLGMGTPVLPHLPAHAGDRNRTSPFAFTGNKFEFRALGASQSISWPATVLNTVVAESIEELADELETELEKNEGSIEDALHRVLTREVARIKRIIFHGDGYSESWHAEAGKRGLLNLRNTMDSLATVTTDKNIALFEKYNVLTGRELESRHEIAIEQYFKTINIEGETTAEIAGTMILPAAVRYLKELSTAHVAVQEVKAAGSGLKRRIEQVAALVNELTETLDLLVEQNAELGGDDVHSKAMHMRDNIIPAMSSVRSVCDRLEKLLPDDLWPLPRYREMLFVK